MNVLGIDVGGSGIKGAIVDSVTGNLVSEKYRLKTPRSRKPGKMSETVAELVKHFKWKGPVGCSFPTVVVDGKSTTSGNLAREWVGVQTDQFLSKACGDLPFFVANDADLAGLAEMHLGAGRGKRGKVVMVTIGTGLGTGVFYNGKLIPNIEMGRMYHTDGQLIEHWAGAAAKEEEGLSLKQWARRFDFFLNHLVRILSPDHLIIGGGLSAKYDSFKKYLTVSVPIEVAQFRNKAGIIGAALYASENHTRLAEV